MGETSLSERPPFREPLRGGDSGERITHPPREGVTFVQLGCDETVKRVVSVGKSLTLCRINLGIILNITRANG